MAAKSTGKPKGEGSKKTGFALFLERIQQGRDADWTKEEVLGYVHWQKQLCAVVLGIAWGLVPLKGLEGFISFGAIQLMTTLAFYKGVLRVDEELHGGAGEALADGFGTYTALFVLCWVMSYNLGPALLGAAL